MSSGAQSSLAADTDEAQRMRRAAALTEVLDRIIMLGAHLLERADRAGEPLPRCGIIRIKELPNAE
jgi:hypothetical protein